MYCKMQCITQVKGTTLIFKFLNELYILLTNHELTRQTKYIVALNLHAVILITIPETLLHQLFLACFFHSYFTQYFFTSCNTLPFLHNISSKCKINCITSFNTLVILL